MEISKRCITHKRTKEGMCTFIFLSIFYAYEIFRAKLNIISAKVNDDDHMAIIIMIGLSMALHNIDAS